MKLEGRVGEVNAGRGEDRPLRLGPQSDLIISELQGRYFELARNNRLFRTMVKAVTIAATHNSPIAAATATPVIGILNPKGSGKIIVPLRVAFLTTSGTPAGGQAVLNAITGVASSITATQTGSIFRGLLTSVMASPQGSVCKVYNNVALTGLTPTAAIELDLVGGAAAAAAAGNGGPGVIGEDFGGSLIVPDDTLIAIMAGSGAGTTWIVNAELVWAELDLALLAA